MDTTTIIATVVLLGGITIGIAMGLPVAVAMGRE